MSDPVPTPVSAADAPLKKYDDMTTEEREEYDRLQRKREEKEQAALPYSWQQELHEISIQVPLPQGTRGKDVTVAIKKRFISMALKKPPSDFVAAGEGGKILEGDLPKDVKESESTWAIEDQSSLHITLEKVNKSEWWPHVLTHHPKIDTTKIVPANSKLSDLDGETRGVVEKMMYDNQMKMMGKPDSEQQKKEEALKKFAAAHPELDLSKAKVTY